MMTSTTFRIVMPSSGTTPPCSEAIGTLDRGRRQDQETRREEGRDVDPLEMKLMGNRFKDVHRALSSAFVSRRILGRHTFRGGATPVVGDGAVEDGILEIERS